MESSPGSLVETSSLGLMLQDVHCSLVTNENLVLLIICFSAYYEESIYAQGHYQSVDPIANNETLRMIVRDGGFDVASFLSLPEGEFYSV